MDYCPNASSKRLHFYTVICLFCCFCFCFQGIYTANSRNSKSHSGLETKFLMTLNADSFFQKLERNEIWEMAKGMGGRIAGPRRLLLGGPGSSPPRCISKCGRCTPCKPVHVAVPPGARMTTEYYPEAWRCKCGNKLYMP